MKTVLFWLAGGLEGRGWTHVQLGGRSSSSPASRCSSLLARPLDVLSLGEDEAASLGLPVHATRLALLAPGRARGRRLHGGGGLGALRGPHGAPRAAPAGGTARPPPAARRRSWAARSSWSWPTWPRARSATASTCRSARFTAFVGAPYFLLALRASEGRDVTRRCSRRAACRGPRGRAAVLHGVTLALHAGRGRGPGGTERRGEVHARAHPGRSAARAAGEVLAGRAGRSPTGRATRSRARVALVTSEEEGPDTLTVEDRVRARPLSRTAGRSARSRTADHEAVARALQPHRHRATCARRRAGHALRRRAPARHAGPRPRPGAAGPAPRRARGPPRHRPSAPALPRPGRGARPAAWPCSRSSTTCRARRPGPSAWSCWRRAASPPRARPPPCWAARSARAPSTSRSAATPCAGLPHPLYSFEEAA